jgi:hypothetical protein
MIRGIGQAVLARNQFPCISHLPHGPRSARTLCSGLLESIRKRHDKGRTACRKPYQLHTHGCSRTVSLGQKLSHEHNATTRGDNIEAYAKRQHEAQEIQGNGQSHLFFITLGRCIIAIPIAFRDSMCRTRRNSQAKYDRPRGWAEEQGGPQ